MSNPSTSNYPCVLHIQDQGVARVSVCHGGNRTPLVRDEFGEDISLQGPEAFDNERDKVGVTCGGVC